MVKELARRLFVGLKKIRILEANIERMAQGCELCPCLVLL